MLNETSSTALLKLKFCVLRIRKLPTGTLRVSLDPQRLGTVCFWWDEVRHLPSVVFFVPKSFHSEITSSFLKIGERGDPRNLLNLYIYSFSFSDF